VFLFVAPYLRNSEYQLTVGREKTVNIEITGYKFEVSTELCELIEREIRKKNIKVDEGEVVWISINCPENMSEYDTTTELPRGARFKPDGNFPVDISIDSAGKIQNITEYGYLDGIETNSQVVKILVIKFSFDLSRGIAYAINSDDEQEHCKLIAPDKEQFAFNGWEKDFLINFKSSPNSVFFDIIENENEYEEDLVDEDEYEDEYEDEEY
jgi:hypothetical protein